MNMNKMESIKGKLYIMLDKATLAGSARQVEGRYFQTVARKDGTVLLRSCTSEEMAGLRP